MSDSPPVSRKESNFGNQIFLNEVEEKLKVMRQRRLNRLNAFVDEQSKLSEERTKTKETDPIILEKEIVPAEKKVATVKSRPSFRSAAEKTVTEKQLKSAPEEINEARQNEVKSDEHKEESKKASSTKKLISKFNCVGTSDVTDESPSRSSVYVPSSKFNTFSPENKKLPEFSTKFIQRKTISFPDDFSVELHNKSQFMKNRILHKSIESLNTDDKLQSEHKVMYKSAEALLSDKQSLKLTTIVAPKINKPEPPKLNKVEPPKVSNTELSKVVKIETQKVPETKSSKIIKVEASNQNKIEPTKLTVTEYPTTIKTEAIKVASVDPSKVPLLNKTVKVSEIVSSKPNLQKLTHIEPPKVPDIQLVRTESELHKVELSKTTEVDNLIKMQVNNVSHENIATHPMTLHSNRNSAPEPSFSSSDIENHQTFDRPLKLPMVTFGKSRDIPAYADVSISKEDRKPTPKPGKKFLSLPLELPALASKKLNREEKVLKKFQTNWNTITDILDNKFDVDYDEIENFKTNLDEIGKLLNEFGEMINSLESRQPLTSTRKELDDLRIQVSGTKKSVSNFRGLKRDEIYNKIFNQLEYYATEIDRVSEVEEERQSFLNEVEQCSKLLERKAVKHEQFLQELIVEQVEMIANHSGIIKIV